MGWLPFTAADETRDTATGLSVVRSADGPAGIGDAITLGDFKLSLLALIDPAPVDAGLDDLLHGLTGAPAPIARRGVAVRLRVRNLAEAGPGVEVIHRLDARLLDEAGDAHAGLLGGVEGCPYLGSLPGRGEPSAVGCLAFRIPVDQRPASLLMTTATTVAFDDPLYTAKAAAWDLGAGDAAGDEDPRAALLDRLDHGAEAWNAWRAEEPEHLLDLAGTNLRGRDLVGFDFSEANVAGTDFTDADLRGARFTAAHARQALFARARLDGADFADARLEAASFYAARAQEASFRGADLTAATLERLSAFNADFDGADLTRADLTQANIADCRLRRAGLRDAKLREAIALQADLVGADLRSADLTGAYLADARAAGAALDGASLYGATLARADLTGARFPAADLRESNLVGARLQDAVLDGAKVYGASVWSIAGTPDSSDGLVITTDGDPNITVDDLQVAQFVHLLIANEAVRDVIDTVTAKTVLILGRFTDPRKRVLDALRNAVRERDLVPIVFDFDRPSNRDLAETVRLLAHMARFILADLTDPSSVPHELADVVTGLPSVPVQPLILAGEPPYALFDSLRRRCHWVLDTHEYASGATLIEELDDLLAVIEARRDELSH